MDSIIVGTDGSEGAQAAVAEAARLASAFGQRVVLVSAYSANNVTSAAMMPHAPLVAYDGRADAEKVLSDAAGRLRAQGLDCATRAVCGSAADAILDVAELERATAIVVGSRGMRGAGRLLGSVPNTVSHKAPCSVMIVRTD
jgi:nucleotide-binding universal stress UspA family protein